MTITYPFNKVTQLNFQVTQGIEAELLIPIFDADGAQIDLTTSVLGGTAAPLSLIVFPIDKSDASDAALSMAGVANVPGARIAISAAQAATLRLGTHQYVLLVGDYSSVYHPGARGTITVTKN